MPRRSRRTTAQPRSFYNLPSPWNPGYALPADVNAEGLERGTFVTKWLPRGSYDQPKVGTGGYAVPKYVLDEGYGQGTITTKWAPRGTAPANPDRISQPTATLVGIRNVKNQGIEYQVDVPMGDDFQAEPTVDPFVRYGQRASSFMLDRLMSVPAAQRKEALRTLLNAVDPALWETVSQRATKAQALGMAAKPALQRALASAMSDGILNEVVQIGKTSTAPPLQSLVGLGCYGCAAVLGAVIVADNRGKTSTAPPPRVPPKLTGKTIVVGPFTFGATGSPGITVHKEQLPPAWKAWLKDETARLTNFAAQLRRAGTLDPRLVPTSRRLPTIPGRPVPPAPADEPLPVAGDFGLDKWLDMKPTTPVYDRIVDGTVPLMRVKNPVTGTDFGIFIRSTPSAFTVAFKEVPPPSKSWLGKLWDGIKWVAGKIADGAEAVYDYAKDAAGALADMACSLLNSNAASSAAAAAAGASGAPPQAGAQGTQIAAGICSTEPKDNVPPPVIDPPPSSLVTYAAILGGVGAAAYLLLRKKGGH